MSDSLPPIAAIDAYFDGEATDDELRELRRWLDENPHEGAQLLSERAFLHARLEQMFVGERGEEATTKTSLRSTATTFVQRGVEYVRRPTPFSFTVAALVMLLMVTTMAFMVPPFYRAMTREKPTIESELQIVAKLTGLRDAVWAEGQPATHRGAFLQSGQRMELTAGLAEVTYDNGAQVIIEAPAILTISGQSQCDVALGKVVSRVPESAHGFTVNTKYGRVVDLGTEFAVEALASGEADVHVIEGRVEIRPDTDDSNQTPRQLTAGQAVRIQQGQGSRRLVEIKYDQQRFARKSLSSEDQWNEESPLPVTHDLSLWLAADFGVVRDADGRVVFWKDRLTGDNRHAENASQGEAARRPMWVADACGGQPAIRFDGRANNLITATRAINDEQTIIAVFVPDPVGNGGSGGQLFHTGSVPNFVLEVVGNEVAVRSWNGTQSDPQLRGKVSAGTPVIVAFTHSRTDQQSHLIVNGESQVFSAAPQPLAARSKAFIGSHIDLYSFYHGDLAELIVFDAALSEAELAAVQQYLRQKHQL